MKKLLFLLCGLAIFPAHAYKEKCIGPLDPDAMYKIAAPFGGDYDFSYEKYDEAGKKYTCFVKVKDLNDAIDFAVKRHPDLARLIRYKQKK